MTTPGEITPHSGRETVGFVAAVRLARRHWWVPLTCSLAAGAAAFAFSSSREDVYTGKASILFRDPGFDERISGGDTNLAPTIDPQRAVATNVKLVQLPDVAARAAGRFRDLSAKDLEEKVEATAEGQSDIVTLSAEDRDPEKAARIANVVAEEFIASRRQADRRAIEQTEALVERRLANLPNSVRSGAQGRALQERLDFLAVLRSLQTGNAELAQRARIPDEPSSPRPKRDAVLAAFLGLLIGLLLVFARSRFDRTLHDPAEVERVLDRSVLGRVLTSKSLDVTKPLDQLPPTEAELFRLLSANLLFFSVDRPLRSVLVTSAMEGEGKSTVAWHLASAASEAGKKVILVEADLRRPGLAKSYHDTTAGLSHLLAGRAELIETVRKVPVRSQSNGTGAASDTMDVLFAGPRPPNPADLLGSSKMADLLRGLELVYDLVIVDSPPTLVVADAFPLVRRVNGVLIVVGLGKVTAEALRTLSGQLEHLEAHTLGVVLNFSGHDSLGYGYGYFQGSDPALLER